MIDAETERAAAVAYMRKAVKLVRLFPVLNNTGSDLALRFGTLSAALDAIERGDHHTIPKASFSDMPPKVQEAWDAMTPRAKSRVLAYGFLA